MKKLAIFVAAFVLTLGLAQCKKEQPNAETPEGGNVHITVNVGDNGSKADINTSNGHITYKNGDQLYVGYNSAKVGVLTYSSSNSSFSGDLSITQDGDDKPLYFYYMGGGSATMVDATHYTVDISSQTSNYPVISCGTSTQPYTGAGAYKTTLYNKCGLVKFSTSVGNGTVNVDGMITEARLNFETGEITPGTTPGTISFNTDGYGEGWAILLEQDAVNGATVSASGFDNGTCNVPEITNNLYYTAGVSAILQLAVTNTYQFTINGSGGTVYFSESNLEGNFGVYSFAEDYWRVGRLYDFDHSNNVPGWRVLSWDEWYYLFNSRTDAMAKYGFANIIGHYGIIILPDDCNSVPGFTPRANSGEPSWEDNNDMVWEAARQQGAIFLPAEMGSEGTLGQYWSSTTYSFFGDEVQYLYFGVESDDPYQVMQLPSGKFGDKNDNYWVRVVRDAN